MGKKKAGRRKLKTKDKRLNIRIEDDVRARYDAAAGKLGISLAKWVLQACEQRFDREAR